MLAKDLGPCCSALFCKSSSTLPPPHRHFLGVDVCKNERFSSLDFPEPPSAQRAAMVSPPLLRQFLGVVNKVGAYEMHTYSAPSRPSLVGSGRPLGQPAPQLKSGFCAIGSKSFSLLVRGCFARLRPAGEGSAGSVSPSEDFGGFRSCSEAAPVVSGRMCGLSRSGVARSCHLRLLVVGADGARRGQAEQEAQAAARRQHHLSNSG